MRQIRPIDGKTAAQIVMLLAAAGLIGVGCFYPQMKAIGGYNTVTPLPPPPPPPPPPPVFIPPPKPPFTPPVVVPTDVTSGIPQPTVINSLPNSTSLVSISKTMPGIDSLKGSTDFLMVKYKEGTDWSKISPYAIKLNNGTALVAVRKPSNTGMVDTPFGQIAISSNCDVLVMASGNGPVGHKDGGSTPLAWNATGGETGGVASGTGVLRVFNLDGMGDTCKIKLSSSGFGKLADKVLAIPAGVELVASTSPLTTADLKPRDGISRRKAELIDKQVALVRFNVESVLHNDQLITSLTRADSGSKEKRVISDMSKMAAVLNQVHGSWGYEDQKK